MDPGVDSKNEDAGLFIGLEDCKFIFKRLKKDEYNLKDEERFIFHRLEKLLYSKLSIKEIEDL